MKKKYHFLIIFLGILVAGICFSVKAQNTDKSEEPFTVEITTEENGAKKSFKKTYKNREEFLKDQEYQKFFGEDKPHKLFFHRDEDFDFSWGDDFPDIMFFDKDDHETWRFDTRNLLKNKDSMMVHLDRSLELLDERLADLDIRVEISPSGPHNGYSFSTYGTLEIGDFDSKEEAEIIKQNKLVTKNELKIHDLSIRPARGKRIKLKFETNEALPLQVRVYDLDGQNLYLEELVKFQGFYDRTIDLDAARKGTYILDIQQAKKKYSKKITISD